MTSFAQAAVNFPLVLVSTLTVTTQYADVRSMCGLQEMHMAKTVAYELPLPSGDTYSSRYKLSERENSRDDELPDDESAEERADTRSHFSGPNVVLGGLGFRTIDVGGARLLDADSQRWIGRLVRKEGNQRAILRLSAAPSFGAIVVVVLAGWGRDAQ